MQFLDPNIARKNELQNTHLKQAPKLPNGEPIFSHIEFSLTGLCNRKCSFCPRADPEVYPNLNEFMPLEMYRKLLMDLKEVSYQGGLSYSGFSEPLLHKGLVDFVKTSREILPGSRLEIVTNGDKLNAKITVELFEAGLTTLLISMYDGPEQIPEFEAIIAESKVDPKRVILRKRYLSQEEHYGLTISNRAGAVNIKELGVQALKEPLNHPCFYPHYRLMVDHTGDVLLCPHDWIKKVSMGNLKDKSIIDIWTGSKIMAFRKNLGAGNRKFDPCKTCDVKGTLQGREHFEAWDAFYHKDAKLTV